MIDVIKNDSSTDQVALQDGIGILASANATLDAIGQKLEIMRKLAACAADSKCDPVRRIELNLLFRQLGREIDELAHTPVHDIQLLKHPVRAGS